MPVFCGQLLLVFSRDPLLQHPGVRCALRIHLRLPIHPLVSERERERPHALASGIPYLVNSYFCKEK